MSKHVRSSFLIIALFFSLGSLTLNTVPDRVSAAHLLHPEVTPATSGVQTIQFESKLLGKSLPYNVLLPVGYYPSIVVRRGRIIRRMNHYPVLYLLHGGGAHYDQWTSITKLSDYARPYRMIVVMPEGDDGFYTDSATITKDKYESYILEELIPDVERRFRALPTRSRRSIAGLSMGGYGALKFGVKHPDKFVFVGSMSGAISAASWTDFPNNPFAQQIKTAVFAAFGPAGSPTRVANDLYKLYGELPMQSIASLPYVYLNCGTEDPLQLPSNRSFVGILQARNIPHLYHEFSGNHDAVYWDKHAPELLRIADQKMREP
jgi:S-formylglutathione hydrolase FrmB